MAETLTDREQALRALPLPYSLALRLRDAGVAPEVVCEYLDVEEASLEGLYRMAEAKLSTAQNLNSTSAAGRADAGNFVRRNQSGGGC